MMFVVCGATPSQDRAQNEALCANSVGAFSAILTIKHPTAKEQGSHYRGRHYKPGIKQRPSRMKALILTALYAGPLLSLGLGAKWKIMLSQWRWGSNLSINREQDRHIMPLTSLAAGKKSYICSVQGRSLK